MLAALTAAQQGIGLSLPVYSIRIDGLEVVGRGGVTAYGVDPATVELVEAASGAVSDLAFVIDDPTGVFTVAQGQYVRMEDLTADMPLFAGWVESFSVSALGIGRRVAVSCVGIEAALDWAWVPPTTIPAGTDILPALQMVASAALWPPDVTLRWSGTNTGHPDITTPVVPNGSGSISLSALSVGQGSLRQTIRQVLDAFYAKFSVATNPHAVTVDFYGNVRVGQISPLYANLTHADYAVVTTTTAAAPYPGNTQVNYGVAGARAVIVTQGTDVTYVSDGSNAPGPIASVTGTTGTVSADARYAQGYAYLAQQGSTVAGTTQRSIGPSQHVTQGIGTSSAQRRAGSRYTHTEATLGVSGLDAAITSIRKRFTPSGEEDWTISFGGNLQQTGTALLRRSTPTAFI